MSRLAAIYRTRLMRQNMREEYFMGHVTFKPQGVCSVQLDFDLEDGKLHNVKFQGGCNGNLKAISRLVNGMKAEEIATKLAGNTCGARSTSCADQLAKAVLS